jgi:hypothetical protein
MGRKRPIFCSEPLFSFMAGQRRKREKRNPTGSFCKKQAKPNAPLILEISAKVPAEKSVPNTWDCKTVKGFR